MKKEEILYRDFCRENKKQVKKLMHECLQFNDGRFEKAIARIKKARFYLKNDEQLRVLQEWRGKEMGIERAIVLAHYCNTPLSTFKVRPLFEEYAISKYGVFYKKGESIYRGMRFEGKTHKELKEWVREYEIMRVKNEKRN